MSYNLITGTSSETFQVGTSGPMFNNVNGTTLKLVRDDGTSLAGFMSKQVRYTVVKTSDYTVGVSDDVILVDPTSNAIIITLPTITNVIGSRYTFIRVGTGTNAISISTTDTILGMTSPITLTTIGSMISFVATDYGWICEDRFGSPIANPPGSVNTNGTTNTYARSDHIHESIAPTYNVNATAVTTSTANGIANAVLISGMTITPGVGKFLVIASANVMYSTKSGTMYLLLYANNAAINSSARYFKAGTNNGTTELVCHSTITVAAAQAIELRWYGAGGTMSAYNRSIDLVRIG